MSLINKMLQELDKRHAGQEQQRAPEATRLEQNLRSVKSVRVGSEIFWRVMALVMVGVVGWVAWVMWQIMPRQVVTELAIQSAQKGRIAQAPAAKGAAAEPAPQPSAEALVPGAVPGEQAAVTQPAASGATAKIDMLRLATELTAPAVPAPPARGRDAAPGKAGATQAEAKAPKAASSAAAAPAVIGSAAPKADAPPATRVTPASVAARREARREAAGDAGRIDKRVSGTTRDRADREYRRATVLVNQGRVSEGMEGLRAALSLDAGHDAARQMLVTLLLESRRIDDAASILQDGLIVSPTNQSFAMLLARIMVDRKDVPGALELLQRHAPAAATNADYHAFTAALFQRLGRHREAIEEYQMALKIAPSTGVWWVGLAISHEASDRPKEAWDAFRRAKATGNLTPELIAFVDGRIKQHQ